MADNSHSAEPAWLEQAISLYHQGYSLKAIRESVGVSSVHYWFRKKGLELREPGRRPDPESKANGMPEDPDKRALVEQMIALKKEGKTLQEIATSVGASPATVDRWLVRSGHKTPIKRARQNQEVKFPNWVPKAVKLYQEGHTLQEVAEKLNTTSATIGKWLRRTDIDIRPAGRKRVPSSDMERIKELRSEKKTFEEIAEELGVSPSTIRNRLMLMGEPTSRVGYTRRSSRD